MATTGDAAASEHKLQYVWQDREVRFDVPVNQLELRAGEVVVDAIEDVEDTKGNNAEHGALVVTSLRITWASQKTPRTNLTIGFNSMVGVTLRLANSRLRGPSQSVYILTKQGSTRFEFIFTNLMQASPRLFTSIQSVQQ
jgi:Bardet-Biedl syndrome 5 protein